MRYYFYYYNLFQNGKVTIRGNGIVETNADDMKEVCDTIIEEVCKLLNCRKEDLVIKRFNPL